MRKKLSDLDRKQMISFRCSPWLAHSISAEALRRGCSKTDLVIEILEKAMSEIAPVNVEQALEQIKASPDSARLIRDLAAGLANAAIKRGGR